jgi:multiple sugar transport system substrate-binding protein
MTRAGLSSRSKRMSGKRIDEVRTMKTRDSALSRRHLLKAGGAAALAVGVAPSMIPGRARAQQKTLKILQWKHFVPSYDEWFNKTYVKEWGNANDTQVIVDNVGLNEINARATAESEAQRGHDLVLFLTPAGMYEDQVIDHREIYEECERRYGKMAEFGARSTYNPKTSKYYGFSPSYQPPVIIYRRDLWAAVRARPNSWADVLDGGRRIKLLDQKPVGFSLGPENNSDQTMRAIMYSFGSSEQDGQGNPALDSKETLEAIKYVKALYEEAMTEDVLTWDPSSNNRFMLEGQGCLTLDTVSVPRASESIGLPIAKDLWLSGAPEGLTARLAPPFSYSTYIIWSFADNIDGGKQFLVDLIGHSRDAFLASGFQNTPAFPDTVPDLATVVANDARASPPDKYALLADVASWTTNVGHPGYTNPAISEVFQRGLIPTMFAQAATGQLTPDEALSQADSECRRIFQEWQERGKV